MALVFSEVSLKRNPLFPMPTPSSPITHGASQRRRREAPQCPPRVPLREKDNASPERPRHVPDVEDALELEALRAGDPDALNRLVHRHNSNLYRAIFRVVRDPDQTQSLVQETFFQALRSLHTFRARSKLSTWLYSIAMNVTRNALRWELRHKGLEEDEVDRLTLFTALGKKAEP